MNQLPDFNHDKLFSVPEGYFDTLVQRTMERIPANEVRMIPSVEKKKSNKHGMLWARYGVAAAAVAAFFTLGMHFISNDEKITTAATANNTAAYSSDYNVDALADYIMVDDQDLYAYISGE